MSADIKLRMALHRDELLAGQEVLLTLVWKNSGSQGWYVNRRFAVAPDGDVRLSVKHGQQTLPPRPGQVHLRPIDNGDFVLLEPGQRLFLGHRLSDDIDLSRPGDYLVQAEYVSEEVPEVLKGLPVFTAKLTCADLKLRIK